MMQQVQIPLRRQSLDAGPRKASLRIGSLHRNPCVAELRFFLPIGRSVPGLNPLRLAPAPRSRLA